MKKPVLQRDSKYRYSTHPHTTHTHYNPFLFFSQSQRELYKLGGPSRAINLSLIKHLIEARCVDTVGTHKHWSKMYTLTYNILCSKQSLRNRLLVYTYSHNINVPANGCISVLYNTCTDTKIHDELYINPSSLVA